MDGRCSMSQLWKYMETQKKSVSGEKLREGILNMVIANSLSKINDCYQYPRFHHWWCGALQSSDGRMLEFGVGQMRAAIIQSNARLLSVRGVQQFVRYLHRHEMSHVCSDRSDSHADDVLEKWFNDRCSTQNWKIIALLLFSLLLWLTWNFTVAFDFICLECFSK